jgi:capsid protein
VDKGKYCVTGTFELFDPQKEGVVGGIAKAVRTGKRDSPSRRVQSLGGDVDDVHRKFACDIARQLAKGLGY